MPQRGKISLIKDKREHKNLKELFFEGKQYRFKKGQLILRPDIVSTGIYYIEKGFVRVYYLTESGREKLHVIYKQGELFPLLWVLKRVFKDAYYEAMGEVVCRKIDTGLFLNEIKLSKGLVEELNHKLLDLLNVFINRLDNLETSKAYSRVIGRLLFLVKRFGIKREEGILVDAPVTHKDIADSVSLSRESASREIEILEKKKLVLVVNHKFLVPNVRKLQNELTRSERS